MLRNPSEELVIAGASHAVHPSGNGRTDRFLSVEVIHEEDAFDKIQVEWSSLVERTPVHIFQSYEWQRLWWQHFGWGRSLHILLFRHQGVLVGIAPLFLDTPKFMGLTISRNLCLLGSDTKHPESNSGFDKYSPSDYLDLIALPGFEKDISDTLFKYLKDHASIYDRLVLKEMAQNSVLMTVFVPALKEQGWRLKISRGEICPRLNVPDSIEEFKRGLHSKVRYQLFQTKRSVTEQGLFSVEAVNTEETLGQSFPEFVRLHQRRWNRLGYPGAFANEHYQAFLYDVARVFLRQGWLWFKTARSDGRCIAAQCAFKFKDLMYDYLKAFDDESPEARRRPGRALLLFLIEEAIQERIRVVDFLRGGEKYKFELTQDGSFNWHAVIFNPLRKNKWQLLARAFLAFLPRLHCRWAKELTFLRVHLQQWGIPRFAFRYSLFLSKRLRDSLRPKHPSTRGSSGQTIYHPRMEQELAIEVIAEEPKFLALREEWEHLVGSCPVSIFQTFDWQWLWWKHCGERLRLHILTFRTHGRLVGIAPLYLDECSVFGVTLYRRLRFMGRGVEDWRSQWDLAQFGPSDYLDVVALPEFREQVAGTLLAYLQRETLLDEMELENIPEGSLLLTTVVPKLQRQGRPYKLVQDHVCPRITLPSSLQEYLRGRSPKFRYQLSQTRRAATEQSLFSIEAVRSREDLRHALPELIRLHQLRWNRIGYPGIFADKQFQKFQEEVAERFLEKGWLWLKTLRMDGRCIAARLGFKFKDSMCDYLAGFDDRSPGAKRRPGFALILSMMEDAIQSKMHTLDLLRGYETYKFDLTSEILNNWKLVIPNPASQQSIRARMYRVVHYLEFLWRKVVFEGTIFMVHYRQHPFPYFLFRYLTFRSKKLSEKLKNELRMAKAVPDDR